jgi:hypothetical protein
MLKASNEARYVGQPCASEAQSSATFRRAEAES